MHPIQVSFCYAREDERLRDDLERHLGALKRLGLVFTWHDRKILPGTAWEQEIDARFNISPQVIILLVSPYFVDSNYCYGVEMQKALEMHNKGRAHVIPIILRPVDWRETPLGKLQALPTDGKPIVSWRDRNAAMVDVVGGIRRVITSILTQQLQKDLLGGDGMPREHSFSPEGDEMSKIHWYGELQYIHINDYSEWYYGLLDKQKAYEAIEQVLTFDPLNLVAHHWKGGILFRQAKYHEAIAVFEHTLQLDPNDSLAYRRKGRCFFELGNYEEALAALDHALQLRSDDLNAYLLKGHLFSELQRHEEALAIYKQIHSCDTGRTSMYYYMARELRCLGRVAEAEKAERIYHQWLMENANFSRLY